MTHPTDDSLKPCPFCGGAASLHPRTCDKNTPYNPADRAFPVARCGQCGAEALGKDWGKPETAAEKWNARVSPAQDAPIDMVLHCPKCGEQHIDAPEPGRSIWGSAMHSPVVEVNGWANPPHRSHLCHGCDHIWRPADVPTNGVLVVKTKGSADSPVATPSPEKTARMLTEDEQAAIIDLHNTGRAQGDHECAEAIQRAAFRVNAGKRIPLPPSQGLTSHD